MTGYGKAEFEFGNKKFTLEIKSLNSKQLDISTRIPALYREKDLDIRRELSDRLVRGKIDFNIYMENLGEDSSSKINEPVLLSYYHHLEKISRQLNLPVNESLLSSALRLPDAVKTEYDEPDEQEWLVVLEKIRAAIDDIDRFRNQEGLALEKDLRNNIQAIEILSAKISQFEVQRIEAIKTRINESLEALKLNGSVDQNRFEQELIFYLEKLDINEEKVRLKNHLHFFIEILNHPESSGKKLGFIAQEIGREINTIGSKANESNIQRIVVEMKDYLERIKEQVMNVL
jgi:uncharacterized protein (TIGR00255 family)